MSDRLVTLRDGRRLGVTGLGDPASARVVVFCHPVPGAAGFDPDPEVTSSWGAHVMSIDRPGYGSSAPLPQDFPPSLARHADDVAEYLARVVQQARESSRSSLDKIGVVGWSAGGRVALAIAARHPGLVDRVAVVATPAPDSAVRWIPKELAGVAEELQGMAPAEAKARLSRVLKARVPGEASGVELLASGAEDLAALGRGGLRGRLERMLQQAYLQGTVGVVDDLLASAGDDWGFDLSRVRAKTLLVYGARDPLAPSAHGRWYRRHLRHARLEVVPRAGHLVIANAWPRILQHVDPQHGDRSDV